MPAQKTVSNQSLSTKKPPRRNLRLTAADMNSMVKHRAENKLEENNMVRTIQMLSLLLITSGIFCGRIGDGYGRRSIPRENSDSSLIFDTSSLYSKFPGGSSGGPKAPPTIIRPDPAPAPRPAPRPPR